MPDSFPAVRLVNVSKSFGDVQAVKHTNLEIRENEFFSILGPSGCGKTTLMRLIAGFEVVSSGSIELSGKDVTSTPTRDRDLNMLFQSYALFPHLSVFENVAFELKVRKTEKEQLKRRVSDALELVRMKDFGARLPDQLSGGQKQRVALARAIVGKPAVILLDEPLGALDKQLRKEMQFELKRLQREVGCTFIYVTHDQEEALSMSDRIAVMRDGEIHQIGSPQDIYKKPKTRFVATFIGDCNLFQGVVNTRDSHITLAQNLILPIDSSGLFEGSHALIIRPESIRIHSKQPEEWSISGRLSETNYLGDEWILKVKVNESIELLVRASSSVETNEAISRGDEIWLSWNIRDALLLKGNENE